MTVALIALFVALGGVGYAAATIGSGDVINNSLRSQDIRNGTIRGKDVRRNSLGARQVRDPRYREVGAPGQPGFLNGARNYSVAYSTAAFLKDSEGFVHLKGTVTATTAAETNELPDVVVFRLPPSYRPSRILDIGTVASGTTGAVYVHPNGDVEVAGPAGVAHVGLDGITFRAERPRGARTSARSPNPR
jgi:hypothetical protein